MKPLVLTAALVAFAAPAVANEYQPAMETYLADEISTWMNNPVLIQAIKSQNTRMSDLDQAAIDELDLTWRAEVGSGSSQMISDVLENEAANFLRQQQSDSSGVISEIFTMDAHGLNVAASNITSDYWQGDEDKYQKTYLMGSGAVHFGEVEFDESSQTYQGQISVVILDPDNNQPIGAMTIGVNVESLL